MGQLFQELKRRNIFRVGIAYAVLAWFILQVGAIVAPALELPEWTLPFVIFILAIGFPFILIFAWAFELTPEGLKKTSEVGVDESLTANTGKKLNHVIIAVLSLAVVALLVDRIFVSGNRTSEVAEVTEIQIEEPSTPGVNRKDSYDSIAVLPFVNMSDDAQQEYFSDGISEELLNLLAKNRALRVAARTSSFAYKGQNQDIKEIGTELDVDTVLEGSVRKSGARLRITAQLIETNTGYHLWSDTYDRELTDVFAIQDEISQAIVGALQIHLSGETEPVVAQSKVTNLDAYNSYLKGRHNLEKREKEPLYQALANFDEAITFDPTYAPAYSGKADAYLLLSTRNYGDIPDPQANKLAEPVISKSLELDPLLAEAHASQGLLLHHLGEYEAAIRSLNRAIEISPNLARAFLWRGNAQGDLGFKSKEIADFEIAAKLDPRSIPALTNLSREYAEDHQFDKAQVFADRLIEIAGEKSSQATFAKIFLVWNQGQLAEAHRIAADYKERTGAPFVPPLAFTAIQLMNVQVAIEASPFPEMKFWVGYLGGDFDTSRQAFEQILNSPDTSSNETRILMNALLTFAKGDEGSKTQAADLVLGMDRTLEGSLFSGRADRIEAPWAIEILQASGRLDEVSVLIDNLKIFVNENSARGHDRDLDDDRAIIKIHEGDLDGAMAILKRLGERHSLYWYFDRWEFFDPLKDRDDYNQLMDDTYVYLNAERAKLGWEPITREVGGSAR